METRRSAILFTLFMTALTLPTVSATGVLTVRPTNETSCPQQLCHTIEHYAKNWQLYLTSDTVVQFLPGEHILEGDWNALFVENVSNLTLIGSDNMIVGSSLLGIPIATSRISCRKGKTGFIFYNVTELFIARLTFSECGGGLPEFNFTLYLAEVSNLVIDSATIQNSTGTGLYSSNVHGKSLIHHSTFLYNDAITVPNIGNVALFYQNCSEATEMTITSSWILFGTPSKYPLVGGLSLQLSYSDVKVHIYNTTMKGNVGGNMILAVDSSAHSIITISNSHFEDGHSPFCGGGILILQKTHYNTPECIQNNHVYITNSEFVGNHAELDGGAVMYLSDTSSCVGTELYNSGSNFYNNAAQRLGGHITISLTLDPTKSNLSITVINSHFEDGKAYFGGGLSVLLGGSLQSTVTSVPQDVYILNNKFCQNVAGYGGGIMVLFHQDCPAAHIIIHNVSLSRNTAADDTGMGGNIAIGAVPVSGSIQGNLTITVSNSDFNRGRAHVGGGLSVTSTSNSSCTTARNTLHLSVNVLNSKFYQNTANLGGGMAIQLNGNPCFTTHAVIDNVSLSNNTAINNTGGNIYILAQTCVEGNSVTVSGSAMEFGNASGYGGGMIFITRPSEACTSSTVGTPSTVRLKPTTVNIEGSTFRFNSAHEGGGGGLAIIFDSSGQFCCSAEVNIADVTFLNNTVSNLAKPVNLTVRGGGNIWIGDRGGQYLNNTVRVTNCLIEGGVAWDGGGIFLSQSVISTGSSTGYTATPTVDVLFISNTQFVCNQANGAGSGSSSLKVEVDSPNLIAVTSAMTKKFTVVNTTFDGTCSESSNVIILGTTGFIPNLLINYHMTFFNVTFKGPHLSSPYFTLLSPQIPDSSFSDVFMQFDTLSSRLYTLKPGVHLSFVSSVTFTDCKFIGSITDGAVLAVATDVFFEGNVIFRNNTAVYGGGLTLADNSIMYLRPNTHILFSHNHAMYAGGAIYVRSDAISMAAGRCFYQFDGTDQIKFDPRELNIQITFENNTAIFAGSSLYGGDVDFCYLYQAMVTIGNYFGSIFHVENTDDDPSALASNPYAVCLCNDSKPQCGNHGLLQVWSMYTYPGALFQVEAVVVGQKDGIVPGAVYATLNNTSAQLGALQESQSTGKSCTTLNYTVFSSRSVEIVSLTFVTGTLTKRFKLPGLVMKVKLLPCPWGFTLTGFPLSCDCSQELQNHHVYKCNITSQTVTSPPSVWIGYYHPGNDSAPQVGGVLVHDDCPFDYCKLEELLIHLNDSDKQCAFNRSGILCGACQTGLSLALGTSRCLKCSNRYLGLWVVFTVAGLALVFLLTLTNMTISEGAINGLIFYANIVHINRAIFFPTESTEILRTVLDVLSTFIAWINLDLGIETCFYNGMDMYTKAWLQFLFPIYIWMIVGAMIISSHYSTTAAKLFRRHAVKVLATLFLLSFAKIQRTIITALSFTFLTYPDGTKKTLWLYDSNIEYLHGKHIPLFLAALLVLLLLLIPYTLVLLLIQCLFKLNHRIFFWVRKLMPLLDAYTGPYKDRYRFWTGLLLVIRTILFLIFTLGNPAINLVAIILASVCLAFMPGVYKKVLHTLLEYSFLLNLSAVSVATFYSRYTQFSSSQEVVVCVSAGMALLTFSGILVYHLYQCITNSQAWKSASRQFSQRHFPLNDRELVNIAAEGSDEEEEEPAQAEIRPLILQFDEYREPVLAYEDQD